MHRTVYTVQKAAFRTEVYGASSHRMDSGCYMYSNQNSINIPMLTQKLSIDYDETFSPVLRFSSVRALVTFAVENDMLIHQMDVVIIFLN